MILRVDGGSRGNPGPAGYGVVVCNDSGEVVQRLKGFLGQRTNNYAEYSGLIAALKFAQQRGEGSVQVYADSELLVRQMQGRYRVQSETLKPLFEQAKSLAGTFGRFQIDYVPREQNREADRLANEAMDEGLGGRVNVAQPVEKPADQSVRGIVRAGRIEVDSALPWPDGTEVTIRSRAG